MTPPRDLVARPLLAGEREPRRYDSASVTDGATLTRATGRTGVLDQLGGCMDDVDAVDVRHLSESALSGELRALQTVARRIEARLARGTSELSRRRAAAARAAGGDDRKVDQARRQVRGEIADALKLSPAQVRQAERVGDRLAATPAAAGAFTAGQLSARHMQILDRTLAPLSGQVRRDAEAELVAAAREQSTVEFHDTCTRLLARLDRAAAERAEALRHHRRTASVVRGEDGMTFLTARLAGIQAEIATTAIHAYRRPDAPGQRRTAEQRTADALTAALQAALDNKAAIDAGAPTKHGTRPHVIVTVDVDTLTRTDGSAGVADGEWTGPLVWDRVRTILDDAGMSFIAIGDDLPVAVASETRNVPVGLYKALALRDGGCIHESCDMPPWWTQVMHLGDPYRDGGRLDLDSAGLGCHHHHTQFDTGQLDLAWTNGRPVLRPPPDP